MNSHGLSKTNYQELELIIDRDEYTPIPALIHEYIHTKKGALLWNFSSWATQKHVMHI